MNFISEEYNELMVRMIVYNPNKRIKLRDVFKSKLVVKFENKKYIQERKIIYNYKKNNILLFIYLKILQIIFIINSN